MVDHSIISAKILSFVSFLNNLYVYLHLGASKMAVCTHRFLYIPVSWRLIQPHCSQGYIKIAASHSCGVYISGGHFLKTDNECWKGNKQILEQSSTEDFTRIRTVKPPKLLQEVFIDNLGRSTLLVCIQVQQQHSINRLYRQKKSIAEA